MKHFCVAQKNFTFESIAAHNTRNSIPGIYGRIQLVCSNYFICMHFVQISMVFKTAGVTYILHNTLFLHDLLRFTAVCTERVKRKFHFFPDVLACPPKHSNELAYVF